MPDLNGMNEAQRRAVTHGRGPLLLLAGPGSGKTFTITKRIHYLLEHGVPPERILVITFTREAAESMQRRFQESTSYFWPVNFGTFHSVFFQILQKSKILKSTELLTSSEKINLLIPILQKIRTQSGADASRESLKEEAVLILAAISYCKNTLGIAEAAAKVSEEWRQSFPSIFQEYQTALKACGRLDFDDMLSRCRQLLLEEASFRKSWQERFDHILIDEFQDINPVQYEVVKLLAGEHCSLFAVGDDDQSIYGFRGSEPECLKRFERENGADRMLLDVNYRSHPEIVRASLAVIGENKDRFVKELKPSPRREKEADRGRVSLQFFPGREEQYAYLAERLAQFQAEAKKHPQAECAVLFRTNSQMQGLAVRLRAAGIPYVMGERMSSVYEHFIARDITAYLRLAAGEWDREILLRVVNRPSRYVSREALGDCPHSVREIREYYERLEMPEKRRREMFHSLEKFERQLKVLGKLSPGLAVAYVQKAVGYENYLRQLAGENREKLAKWQEMMEWLKVDAGRFRHVRDWCAAQEAYTRSLEKENTKRGKREADGDRKAVVRLMTVHGAKGLEFDTVIIPDCNETVYPHGRLPGEAEVEEERRVFYVAMTRAKENLELLCLTGEEGRSRPPSRFLNPLIRDYSSTSSSNSQLSRYSSKASATFSYSSSSSM